MTFIDRIPLPKKISVEPFTWASWMYLAKKEGRNFTNQLPPVPGVYEVKKTAGECLYVGSGRNLRVRCQYNLIGGQLDNTKEGKDLHNNRKKILGAVEGDVTVLEVGYLRCPEHLIEVIELYIHLQDKPKFPDQNLFPGLENWANF